MKIDDVKHNLERPVLYGGGKYYLTAIILRKRNGKFYYQAELMETKGNTIYIVDLEKVEEYKWEMRNKDSQ